MLERRGDRVSVSARFNDWNPVGLDAEDKIAIGVTLQRIADKETAALREANRRDRAVRASASLRWR
jgi:hypothetical protein